MNTQVDLIQWELRRTLHLMSPFTMIAQRKLRVGDATDGGYVMLDDFMGVDAAYSLGIGGNVTWDMQMADLGIIIHQYDHTVEGPPVLRPEFRFNRIAISSEDGPGCTTIASALAANGHTFNDQLILKIDIESAEWPALDATSVEVLCQFRQIVIEVHDLFRLVEPEWRTVAHRVLTRLAQTHVPIHIHANNYGQYRMIENVAVPDVVELCYVRRDRGAFVRSTECFPTALDNPNSLQRPDIILGSFSFL